MPPFQALIENASDVISLVGPAGDILYVSPACDRILGYRPEELVGRNTFDLVHPRDRNRARRVMRDAVAGRAGLRQAETRIRRKNGQWCWVEYTIANLLATPDVAAMLVNCRDSGARRAERVQQQLHSEDLSRSNKELEYFAYAVAHDLREPLRTISMFTEILLMEAALDDHGKYLAQFIVDGTARMAMLLESLHAFAVRGFEEPSKSLDLANVLEQALQNLGHAITSSGANVTVEPLPQVFGNENHLRGVFQNLIMNAIKYRSSAPLDIHVSAEPRGLGWVAKVRDNGIGIAPEDQERVFQLLKRLHGPEIPGAGVGLAICRKIVEASGGAIWVESEAGAGATFCFTIAAVPDTISMPVPVAWGTVKGYIASCGNDR